MSKMFLCFLTGPLSEKKYPLEKPEIFLGSSVDCDICIKSERISAIYMRIYVGLRNVSFVINSSDFHSVLNNELVTQPINVSSGDIVFLPDGSIGCFQSDPEDFSANVDIVQNIVCISDRKNHQQFIPIPQFSRDYFCRFGFDKLNKEEWSLAEQYFVEAQKYDPYYAQIYRGLLFIDLQISSESQILVWDESIETDQNFKMFMDYALPEEKTVLLNRKQTILIEEKQTLYEEANKIIGIASEPEDFKGAIERLEKIQDFRDSKQILDYCIREQSFREQQKKQWISKINQKQKKLKKKSNKIILLLVFGDILVIIACILGIKKINNNKDKAFIETVLTADTKQIEDFTKFVSEKFSEDPTKYQTLMENAFKTAYVNGDVDRCFFITNICLLNESSRQDFSSFIDSEYRDYAIVFTSLNTINNFLDTYDYKNRKTSHDIGVIQIPTIILEESTKTGLDLISRGEFEKMLALVEFFEERIDMSSVVKAVICPMFISQKINTTFGYYDDSSHKFKDSSKRESIGWIEETKTQYFGDLACRKTRYYDTAPRWEGDPDYSWYYKGEYVSSSSCSQLNSVVNKLTNYSFGPFSVKENSSNYIFNNNEESKSFSIKK